LCKVLEAWFLLPYTCTEIVLLMYRLSTEIVLLSVGRVGPRVSVTDPVSDPVLGFIHALCCCFWGENTPPWNLRDCSSLNFAIYFYFSILNKFTITLKLFVIYMRAT